MAEKTARKQRGKPFRKGQSGNPAGRPKGARHKVTLLAERLMQDDAEAVVSAVLNAAKAGDITAARIVLDRIAPARRDSPLAFDLPKIDSLADAVAAHGAILAAVSSAVITPSEAAEVAKLIDGFVKTIESAELEARIAKLEATAERGKQ